VQATKAKRELASPEATKKVASSGADEAMAFISETDILGLRKETSLRRTTRGDHSAGPRKVRLAEGQAKEKAEQLDESRNKPIMMITGINCVREKKELFLREKQNPLNDCARKSRGMKTLWLALQR